MRDEGGSVDPEEGTASADDAFDRPGEEPEGYSQEEQLRVLRAEGKPPNVYFDTSEAEEVAVLTGLFGDPDERGLYHAPDEEQVGSEGGDEA
jgi:hypothetical protein